MNRQEAESLFKQEKDFGITDYLAPIARGATFGFGDEISAAMAAIPASISSGNNVFDAYRDIHTDITQQQKQFDKAHPVYSTVADIGGGVLTGGILGKAAVGSAPTVGRLAGIGAIEGGVAGAGYADQGNILRDTAIGATGGAILSPLLSKGIGSFTRKAPAKMAGRQIKEAMDRDAIDLDYVKRLFKEDPNNLLVDASPNLMAKGRAIAVSPGKGKKLAEDALISRQKSQQGLLTKNLQEKTGGRYDFHVQADELANNKQLLAKPLYDQAHASKVDLTDEMAELFDDKDLKSVWNRANRLYRLETGVEPDPSAIDELRLWDYFKQSMDDEVNSAYKAGHGNLGKALKNKRNTLRGQLDDMVPVYEAARNVYSDASGMEDALMLGRKVLRTDADLPDIKKLKDGEKEMFINGAIRAIRDKFTSGPSTANNARNLVKSPLVKSRLRNAFKDDKTFNSFIKQIEAMAEQGNTYSQIMGGSRTTPLAAEIQDVMRGEGAGMMSDVLQGNFGQAAKAATSNLAKNKNRLINDATSEAMAPLLFGNDMQALQKALRLPTGNQRIIQGLLGGTISGFGNL